MIVQVLLNPMVCNSVDGFVRTYANISKNDSKNYWAEKHFCAKLENPEPNDRESEATSKDSQQC